MGFHRPDIEHLPVPNPVEAAERDEAWTPPRVAGPDVPAPLDAVPTWCEGCGGPVDTCACP